MFSNVHSIGSTCRYFAFLIHIKTFMKTPCKALYKPEGVTIGITMIDNILTLLLIDAVTIKYTGPLISDNTGSYNIAGLLEMLLSTDGGDIMSGLIAHWMIIMNDTSIAQRWNLRESYSIISWSIWQLLIRPSVREITWCNWRCVIDSFSDTYRLVYSSLQVNCKLVTSIATSTAW